MRSATLALICTLTCIVLAAAACQSSSERQDSRARDSAMAYERTRTGEDLAYLIQADLREGDADGAYTALEGLTVTRIREHRATRTLIMFQEARPAALFNQSGGRQYSGAVANLMGLLEMEALGELEKLYEALVYDDMETIRDARQDRLGLLSDETVKLAPKLAPHADFFRGVLRYHELTRDRSPDDDDAEAVVVLMERAGDVFARTDAHEEYFLTLVMAAQALELTGQDEPAMEKWLAAIESDFWPQASDDLKEAISARVTDYRERVRQDVEAEVEAEHDAEVRALEEHFEGRHADAMERIQQLEGRIEGMHDAALEASSERRPAGGDADRVDESFETLGRVADVMTVWQAFRGRPAAATAPR